MSALTICPICSAVCKDHQPTMPYWICPNCDVWFQDPAPPKVYHAAHEPPPEQMSDGDKAVNDQLAGWLFDNVMKGKPGPTLDIGAAYPYLASRLQARGCTPLAVDGESVANDLGVEYLPKDFESWNITKTGLASQSLIVLVHSFEHMYRPIDALCKLRRLVADDGRVFIRSPDHCVPGYERDLTAGHYSIHPFYHTLSSLLQCCVEARDCFEIDNYTKLPGQMDVILRPIKRAPRIVVGMIVKNEERDLPRAIASINGFVDGLTIIDTGSTDRTLEIAQASGAIVSTYTGASAKDEAGDWKLQDFSKARNIAIKTSRPHNADWYMWLDADDVLITPDAIRRAMYWAEKNCFTVWIDGGTRWLQHRMWKANKGVRFAGRVHEYPILDGLNIGQLNDALIVHHAEPHGGEDSNARNLRILLSQWDAEQTPRTAFYIAQTHKDAGRHEEAICWYQKRIEIGQGYRDEWLFAWLYRIRCQRTINSDSSLYGALYGLRGIRIEAPDWMEFRMELAFILYDQKLYKEAIEAATPALDAPIPPTELWRETNMYRDQPARLISWCHEHLGNMEQALEWAKVAKERIGGPDADWDARIARLSAPAIVGKVRDVICVRRAGAIGDVLMTLNLLPALKEANPGSEIWYFTDTKLAREEELGWIIKAAGADQVHMSEKFDVRFGRHIDLVGYPLEEGYPDKPMKRHLLEYFADEMGVDLHGELPALVVRRPKSTLAGEDYITVQRKAGWSKYKQWARWDEICAVFPNIRFVEFDEANEVSLREVIAVFANARMHIGIDSFCNHLTNYLWEDKDGKARRVPGVILWGSTQVSAAGYPHNNNISLGLPCQPCFRENPAISRMSRGPCINPPRDTYADDTPHACMRDISVEQVLEAVLAMWGNGSASDCSNLDAATAP